jgi:hypothetical protein
MPAAQAVRSGPRNARKDRRKHFVSRGTDIIGLGEKIAFSLGRLESPADTSG